MSQNTIPSKKKANFGMSKATNVAVRTMALIRAGFPSSGAKSSLYDINIFSLIFFFIFSNLLYFK